MKLSNKEILVMVDGQGAKYHVHDALGSVTGLVDENGAVVESYLYDVFGHVAVFDGSGVLQTGTGGTASGNRFLYTGREWVAEAGLYDYRNRVYSPKLGRFVQVDQMGWNFVQRVLLKNGKRSKRQLKIWKNQDRKKWERWSKS